jgi:adenylate kinase family enzyme
MRIVILGGARTGKTTRAHELARRLSLPLRHTDHAAALGWHEASDEVATWLDAPGPWIVEGTAAVRALRKWLTAHPTGKPCETVFCHWQPLAELKPGQAAMNKGAATIWDGIGIEVARRGVQVVNWTPTTPENP